MAKIAKTPMVMQMEAAECGAASLCMILAYHKKYLPLEQVRAGCGVSRDGTSAKNIAKAAQNYHLKVQAFKLEPKQIIEKNIPMPAIIHWQFNHFVVLCGFKNNAVVLNDPAIGNITISMEEFDAGFTGIILSFETTEGFEAGGKPHSVMGYALSRLKNSGGSFLFLSVMNVALALTGLVVPVFSQVFIDRILPSRNMEWLPAFTGGLLFIACFQLFLGVVIDLFWLKVEGRFAIAGGAAFLWKILGLPIEFFTQRYAGDIALRQKTNQEIASVFMRQFVPTLINLILLVFYALIMMKYSLILTGISMVSIIINILLGRLVLKKQINLSIKTERDTGALNSITVTGIDMIETIKQAGAEYGFFQKWAGMFAKSGNGWAEAKKIEHTYLQLPVLFEQLTHIATMTVGVYLILDGKYTVGMLMGFLGFLTAFLTPVKQLTNSLESILTMRANMEKIEDVTRYPSPERFKANKDEPVGKLNDIVFENVTFGYSKLEKPLIENFNLHIEKGRVVALVGGSGSGKSTVARLLTGLYSPWGGRILFNGYEMNEICRDEFIASVGMVEQEISLFEDTVRNNITMWDTKIPDKTLITASKDAQIYEDIMSRLGGFDFKVKTDGRNFSGGQKQRIEIARTLAREPNILILDEATSALDTLTEQNVMAAVRRLGITCVIVAHRLSTIRDADMIVVLEQGRIVESGTHEELYSKNGYYTHLITSE